MRIKRNYCYLLFSFYICVTSCSLSNNENSSSDYNMELADLTTLKTEIEALAASSVCNDDSECRFIAFGSKPCGGPWSFLIYSTSIDTNDLENKVAQYNRLEAIFNIKWGTVSDCSLPIEPTDVICENNACVAVY